MKKFVKALIGWLLLSAIAVMAGLGARLVWNENATTESVSKYVIYHGVSVNGPFTNMGEVASQPWSTNFMVLPSLHSGTHYFYVTAVGSIGLESDPGNKVLAPVPNPPQGLRMMIVIE